MIRHSVVERISLIARLMFPALLALTFSGCGSDSGVATSDSAAGLKSIQDAEKALEAKGKGKKKAGMDNVKSIKGRVLGAGKGGAG